MNKIFKILIISLFAVTSISYAQKTTRKVKAQPIEVASATVNDTISASQIADGEIVFSGFDKTLRATRESVFMTNNRTDTISSVKMDIQYFDVEGNQLHRREQSVNQIVPPGETRQLSFRTWDTQKAFYYEKSAPGRGALRATPFRVKINLINITVTH